MALETSIIEYFNDDDSQSVLHLEYSSHPNAEQPDVKALLQRRRPTVLKVILKNLWQDDYAGDILTKVALAVNSCHPHQIKAIHLYHLQVHELGHLYVALTTGGGASTTTGVGKLITFEFHNCNIGIGATKTISTMVLQEHIGELLFSNCSIENDRTFDDYTFGNNQALRRLGWIGRNPPNELWTQAYFLTLNNANFTKLSWSYVTEEQLLQLCRAATCHGESLQCLEIANTRLDIKSIETLLFMCLMATTNKELILRGCEIDGLALSLLFEALRRKKILDSLTLNFVVLNLLALNTREGALIPVWGCWEDCGSSQIRKLDLSGTMVGSQFLLRIIDDVAANPYIQILNLSQGVLDDDRAFGKVCDCLIRPSVGPSELLLDRATGLRGAMISEAMQHNTRLTSLTIAHLTATSLVALAQGLAHNRHLRKLTLGYEEQEEEEEYTSEFFQAFRASLHQNTTLFHLCFRGVRSFFRDNAESGAITLDLAAIHHMLSLNRAGRQLLMAGEQNHIPISLWANVLARSSDAADGIYFVLSEKPDIVASPVPTRKRKEPDEAKGVVCS